MEAGWRFRHWRISLAPEAASDTLHGLNVLSLSRYAIWVLDQGLDLDPEYVFDKGLVFDHCGTYSPEGLKGPTLWTHFARLRRIVSNFNPDLSSVQSVSKKTAKKSQPYTVKSWLNGQLRIAEEKLSWHCVLGQA